MFGPYMQAQDHELVSVVGYSVCELIHAVTTAEGSGWVCPVLELAHVE